MAQPRCPFACIEMVCVLPKDHPSDPILGGHHLIAKQYVDSDEPWDEEKLANFSAAYDSEVYSECE